MCPANIQGSTNEEKKENGYSAMVLLCVCVCVCVCLFVCVFLAMLGFCYCVKAFVGSRACRLQ